MTLSNLMDDQIGPNEHDDPNNVFYTNSVQHMLEEFGYTVVRIKYPIVRHENGYCRTVKTHDLRETIMIEDLFPDRDDVIYLRTSLEPGKIRFILESQFWQLTESELKWANTHNLTLPKRS